MWAPSESRRAALLLIAWIAVIAISSTAITAHGAVTQTLFRLSRSAGARLSRQEIETAAWFLRKAAHPIVYGILALLMVRYLAARLTPRVIPPPLRLYLAAFAFAVIVGVADELHQSIVPDRGGSAVDVLLDAGGAALALLAHFLLAVRRRRAPTPRPRTR